MKFRPLHDRIVVKRITAEEKNAGGIIIPDTAKEKPMEGEVDRGRSGRPQRDRVRSWRSTSRPVTACYLASGPGLR